MVPQRRKQVRSIRLSLAVTARGDTSDSEAWRPRSTIRQTPQSRRVSLLFWWGIRSSQATSQPILCMAGPPLTLRKERRTTAMRAKTAARRAPDLVKAPVRAARSGQAERLLARTANLLVATTTLAKAQG
jgi:hypothetical protein